MERARRAVSARRSPPVVIRRRAFDARDGWWTLRRKHGCFYARGGRWLIRCLCSGHWRGVVWCRRSSAHAGRRVVRRRVLRGGDTRVRWVRGIIGGAHTRICPGGIGRGVKRGGGASIDARRRPLWRVGASRGRRVVWCGGARGGSVPRRWSLRCGETGWWWSLWCGSEHGRWFIRCRAEHRGGSGRRIVRCERSIVRAERRFVRCSAGDRWRLVRRLCAGGWRQHFRWWSRRGAAERGRARPVRRATGGGDDSVRVAVAASSARARHDGARPCEAVFARKDAKSGRGRCGDRVSCAFAHASITVAHEPWRHQQRAEATRRGVGVVAGRRRAKRGNAGVGPATWKRCFCRDAVERWMVV